MQMHYIARIRFLRKSLRLVFACLVKFPVGLPLTLVRDFLKINSSVNTHTHVLVRIGLFMYMTDS